MLNTVIAVCAKAVKPNLKNQFSRKPYAELTSFLNHKCRSSVHLVRGFYSTGSLLGSYSVEKSGDYVEISDGKTKRTLSYVWLRDHCNSERYWNYATNQRKNFRLDFDINSKAEDVQISGMKLKLSWLDGHKTEYDMDWLMKHTFPDGQNDVIKKTLWNKDTLTEVPSVDAEKYLRTDDGLQEHLKNMLEYGVSIVTGVEPTEEGTQEISERLCFIQHTMYGGLWTFTADGAREDTAYNNDELIVHTDNTYLHSTAGIQVFHCLEHTGSGGETLLVDGFRVAEDLHQKHPDAFSFLSQTVIPHENKDVGSGEHVKYTSSVISLDPVTERLQQIRFNPYDRATLDTIPAEKHQSFYEYYDKLTDEMLDKRNEVMIKLKPGMVLFIDNWRVLHGRKGFDGRRIMCGCYLPRDDWIGKARIIGLAP